MQNPNQHFADFLDGSKRMHFPWDLDSALGNLATNKSIYNRGRGPGRAYEDQIIDNSQWRPLYDQTMALAEGLDLPGEVARDGRIVGRERPSRVADPSGVAEPSD